MLILGRSRLFGLVLGRCVAWTHWHIKFIHLIWIYFDGVVSCHVSYQGREIRELLRLFGRNTL